MVLKQATTPRHIGDRRRRILPVGFHHMGADRAQRARQAANPARHSLQCNATSQHRNDHRQTGPRRCWPLRLHRRRATSAPINSLMNCCCSRYGERVQSLRQSDWMVCLIVRAHMIVSRKLELLNISLIPPSLHPILQSGATGVQWLADPRRHAAAVASKYSGERTEAL